MKKFILFLLVICQHAFHATAQIPVSVGDTLGPWTTIDFETPSPWIMNNASLQNLWAIGPPQKTIFNQAYSIPNAIVTGLSGYYMFNNHSWFDLLVGNFNTMGMFDWNLFIDFRHKFDTDTLRDGGYITASWDHGQTWNNIRTDSLPMQCYTTTPSGPFFGLGNTNLYSMTDTLVNGEPGFSGSSNGWIHSCMAWYDIPVKKKPGSTCTDTLILRFNFVSDNIQNNREGWMIDQIRLFTIDLGGGQDEHQRNTLRMCIAPNPVTDQATVTLNHLYSNVAYQLLDLAGKPVLTGNPGRCSKFIINRNGLPPGLYLLKVTSNSSPPATSRFLLL